MVGKRFEANFSTFHLRVYQFNTGEWSAVFKTAEILIDRNHVVALHGQV